MIPKEKHDELPRITYTETGWRQTLAIYRIAVWHEHENDPETAHMSYREALQKLGAPKPEHMQNRIGAIKNINDFMDLKDVYMMCEMISPFAGGEVSMMRMIRVLAQHNIKDIRKFSGDFGKIPGIGPKYAEILTKARETALNKKTGKIFKKITAPIPASLHYRVKMFTEKQYITVSEFVNHAIEYYLNTFEE